MALDDLRVRIDEINREMVKLFVETEFEGGGRHTERVALLTEIENEQ